MDEQLYEMFYEKINEIIVPFASATLVVAELTAWFISKPQRGKITIGLSEFIIHMIDEMVTRGDIVELEYINPEMPYRIKSVYFPKGTTFVTGAKGDAQ